MSSPQPDASPAVAVRPIVFRAVNEVKDAKAQRKSRQAFYTPMALVDVIVNWSDPWPSVRVLEPSAGDGRFVHALMNAGVRAVDVCEIDAAMRENLAAMEANIVGDDFLKYRPAQPYHRILMNPPFKGRTAEKHIEHAWSMLAPGGRLYSIAPTSIIDSITNTSLNLPGCEFATVERLGTEWFKDFGTGIEVVIVELRANDNGPRECVGYSNHATANAALTIESCSENTNKAQGLCGPDQWREAFADQVIATGGSCYGIDWGEVERSLWDQWFERHREEIEQDDLPEPVNQAEELVDALLF